MGTALEATLNGMARIHSSFIMPLDKQIVVDEGEWLMVTLTVNDPPASVKAQFSDHPWLQKGGTWRTQAADAEITDGQWPAFKFFHKNVGIQDASSGQPNAYSTAAWFGGPQYVRFT